MVLNWDLRGDAAIAALLPTKPGAQGCGVN
jgi:hypothetical protein